MCSYAGLVVSLQSALAYPDWPGPNLTLLRNAYHLNHPSGLRLIFSHRPILPLEPNLANLHGHIHNNPAPELEARHVNLCVEVRDYRPWRLGEILAPYLSPAEPYFE